MQSKRRWLPGWQRVELVCLCLDRGMSRREAASYRHVSVSTVQYWIDRYRQAGEEVEFPRFGGHGVIRRRQCVFVISSTTVGVWSSDCAGDTNRACSVAGGG